MNCIIASTSTLHGQKHLAYLHDTLAELYKNTSEILFIPYARPGGISHDAYTLYVKNSFKPLNKKIVGIHEFENPTEAIQNASGIFTGGGNTFVLTAQLHQNKLINVLKESVENGTPYLGTSAGSNICGITMQTTNDMPIVFPSSYKTLGIVPFNINPHYQDPLPNNLQMGETRETRIKEFHEFNTIPVIGLREGSWIHATSQKAILKGNLTARFFNAKKLPEEIKSDTDINKLVWKY